MSQWDRNLVGSLEKKKDHYFFAIAIMTMIVTSLFMAVPTETEHHSTRPLSFEEEQGVIIVLDHLAETLPSQSLTLQNWMNKIDAGNISLLVSDSEELKIGFENGAFVLPSRFFQEDPITQQKAVSDLLGMRFDALNAAEIAFSRE